MGILYNEVVYSKSVSIDFTDATLNGGRIGDSISNDQINNIFPEVSASNRQAGVQKRIKLMVNNNSIDRTMDNNLIHIKQNMFSPDFLIMYEATENETLSFEFFQSLSGSGTTVTAGTSIEVGNLSPQTKTTNDLIGRKFKAESLELTVATAPDTTHITFNEDITVDIAANYKSMTSDDYDFFESDEDFSTLKKHVNLDIKAAVLNGSQFVLIDATQEGEIEVGDVILLTNEYFQVVFRGTVDSKNVFANDNSLYQINLNVPYYGNTIPEMNGSICNGILSSIKNGESKSFWLEMNVIAESNIQAELISQFQIGLHFDDIATV